MSHVEIVNDHCQCGKSHASSLDKNHMSSPHVSLQGQLLLDGGKLRGSFFHRSVVLVCQHNPKGTFGLVLNRVMKSSIGELIPEDLPETFKEHPLYWGGPIQPGALSYLHGNSFLPAGNVMDHLNVGHSLEELIELANTFSPSKRMRVFAGYAGWSSGQLDAELEDDSWLTHPASMDLIFEHDAETLWHHILGLKDWQHRLLSQSPEDLSWN
ncbi:MAG: hypothetical protein M2R45_04544 [Verrucomicrobia subdivision 3 bacterium]|nr:hypothetical protein [Limisphaerales bacterium]MCS1416817.1 hypothetical protein [Limisphaerales bacterium]